MSLKHGYTAPAADVPGSTKVQPSHWNAEHTFTGGATGDVLQRDTGGAGGASWLSGVALGDQVIKKQKYKQTAWMNFWPGNQTPNAVGSVGATVGGTMTDGSDADAPYTTFTTATSGIVLGVNLNTSIMFNKPQHDPALYVKLKTGASIANLRIYVAFGAGPLSSDTMLAHYAGVRFSTAAGDTGFKGICSDNVGQSVTAQIGANVAASTVYDISVAFSGNGTLVTFTVNGVSLTLATTLPTIALCPRAQATNLAAESKTISLAKMFWEWD